MNDEQLLRYSRHILLDEIGIEGQQRLLAGHALVIGAGGLGSPVALYLATAGVGQITLVDDDTVDLTNLQRQIAHTAARIGTAKVTSAAVAMAAINPEVVVNTLQTRAGAWPTAPRWWSAAGSPRTTKAGGWASPTCWCGPSAGPAVRGPTTRST